MIALVLGLVVAGAALALFMTNRQTYTASESLGRIEESERTIFELMSRDVREAAGNQCDKEIPLTEGLTPTTPATWWRIWDDGIHGYGALQAFPAPDGFGTAKGNRVSGTAAIEFKNITQLPAVVTTSMASTTAALTVNTTTGISAGDLLVVCEFGNSPLAGHSNLFQATAVGVAPPTISHAASGNPGNAAASLAPRIYSPGALVGAWHATRWYVGYTARTYNGAPGKSLFRSTLNNVGGVSQVNSSEITQGVSDMQLSYLLKGASNYVDATAVTTAGDWDKVLAVDITLTLDGEEKVGTSGAALQKIIHHIVTLRNRAL